MLKSKATYTAQADLLARLKKLTLPTGGQWYHGGRSVPKPINPADDVAVLAGRDCWLISQGCHSAKVDNQSGAVYFTDRANWTDTDAVELAKSVMRHLPA